MAIRVEHGHVSLCFLVWWSAFVVGLKFGGLSEVSKKASQSEAGICSPFMPWGSCIAPVGLTSGFG